jgi:hypothetical protein
LSEPTAYLNYDWFVLYLIGIDTANRDCQMHALFFFQWTLIFYSRPFKAQGSKKKKKIDIY